jgi:hypothetical protein
LCVFRLAPSLDDSISVESLAIVETIEEGDDRAWALEHLLPHLKETVRQDAIRRALEHAPNSYGDARRAEAFGILAPHIHGPDRPVALGRALHATLALRNATYYARALARLVPHLEVTQRVSALGHALERARSVSLESEQADVLSSLAPYFKGSVLKEALEAAYQIRDDRYRAQALTSLVPFLVEGEQERALKAALESVRRTNREWSADRAHALLLLSPFLDEPKALQARVEALDAVSNCESVRSRAGLLQELAAHRTALPPRAFALVVFDTLHLAASQQRHKLLMDLREIHGLIVQLGGSEALEESAQAIIDVSAWWP